MKPVVLSVALAACLGLGFLVGRRTHPASLAADAGTTERVPNPQPAPEKDEPATGDAKSNLVGLVEGKDSASVRELFTGFDPRRPVESQSVLLQRIMTASPADLAELVKGMTGRWRDDLVWWQAASWVMLRWVELAPDEAIVWARLALKGGPNYYRGSEIFRMLANVNPTRAMEEAQKVADPTLRNSFLQSVIGSISETDPEQAFLLAQTLPAGQRGESYSKLFSNWAERNPAAAAAGISTLNDADDRGRATSALMRHWAHQDPDSALAWAKGLKDPSARQGALQSYFGTFGDLDPQRAIAQIAGLPRHQQRSFLSNLVRSWTRTDPDAATAWVLARPDTIEHQQLMEVAASGLGRMPSELASKLVSHLAPGPARLEHLNRLIDQWIASDPDAAIAFTRSLPAAEEMKLRAQVVQGLAAQDLGKAMAYLKDNPIDDPASPVWRRLAESMSNTSSPSQAIEMVKALPGEGLRRQTLPAIYARMVLEDPVEAARHAAELPDEATRLACLSAVAGTWATTGMEEALTWVKTLSGKDREAAMRWALTQGAQYQPKVAAEEFNALLASLPSGTKPADWIVRGAAETIATAYFVENERAAAHWAANLPQDDARATAVSTLAERWAQHDPAGASEWIGSLPGGKPRDEAVAQLVSKISSSDPATAFAWATTVANSSERSNLLESTVAFWRKVDAPAARTAIEATNWPEDEKTKWLEKVK